MNSKQLKQSEEAFFIRYPDGFEDPQMMAVAKKHKLDKMYEYAAESFAKEKFEDPLQVADDFAKMISRSSLVSVFEKTGLRNLMKEAEDGFKVSLAEALGEMLHGDQQKGFEEMIDVLTPYKLAKWTILTVGLLYTNPAEEVFIKPTTVKKVIEIFGLEDIRYTSKANYEFYNGYRKHFNEMRRQVHPAVAKDNAMFSGFLMMCMEMDGGAKE